jgi:hypothetical protein
LEVNVNRTPVNHPRGFFFIDRLNTKVDKLTAASADKRILLLEKDVPIYGDGEVGELIEYLRPDFQACRHP